MLFARHKAKKKKEIDLRYSPEREDEIVSLLKAMGATDSDAQFYIAVASGASHGHVAVVAEKSYNPRQPRWPRGTPMGGKWKGSGISGRLFDRSTGAVKLSQLTTVRAGLFARDEAAAAKSVLRSIDSVHKVKGIPRLTIRSVGNIAAPFFGAYHIGKARIDVTSSGVHPHMTTAHEIGHFLDHVGFGSKWGSSTSPKFAGWRKAVENSQTIKNWRQWDKDGFMRQGRFKIAVNKNTTKYYLNPREIFARSYAQYIARRSGNRSLLRDLRFLQRSRLQTQWPDDDFEPIARELDKLLRSQGWL